MKKDASPKKTDSGIGQAARYGGRGGNIAVALWFYAILLLALAVLLSGCTEKVDRIENDLIKYAGMIRYVKCGGILACREDSPAYQLLQYVLREEVTYYDSENGSVSSAWVNGTSGAFEKVTAMKSRFAAASSAGFDMTAGEFEEFRETVTEGLYLTYLSDNAAHVKYDAEHDNYETDAFALSAYGVEAEKYVLIRYEETVIERYIDAAAKEIVNNIDPDLVFEYYRNNISEFDFAEADIIITAKDPADSDAAQKQTSELAEAINASDDPEAAFAEEKAKAEVTPEIQDWTEENGFALIRMNIRYAGLLGEIQKQIVTGAAGAIAMEYEGNVYLVFIEHENEYTKESLPDSGIYSAVLEQAAREQAEKSVSAYDLDIIWIQNAEDAEALGSSNISDHM